ncbi:hypothetical protein TREMEDRAFT_26649 [Tremella mesenterica DSM 1558]|uniref:uncharacterized protein n=1 Tax=Tremella mesenterica (strain ATCC 24925 / CBS 8224 / DSM 1558 / NBRC 9311 / NRRL Y-6157 / RJB 2259-6 / UBC 559-6) TaxID=578456 RepID=UPI0003F496DC|nr:uncharacterized protein TREMEDRAFT_26649 [Tremella mesenterica DSM 1558]EIW72124.1 hypothetical protein TREMEDRAFT_26649 [Tremella mesenterica DSM 1558]
MKSIYPRLSLSAHIRTPYISHRSPTIRPYASSTVTSPPATELSASDPSTELTWTPVLPPGQNLAYDTALSFLSSHRSNLLKRLEALRSAHPNPSPDVQAKIDHLSLQADINHPPLRRLFRQTLGQSHMHLPVMRHLAERHWTREGGRDLLMQRIETLQIVPDLLPEVLPTSSVRLVFPSPSLDKPGSIQRVWNLETPPKLHMQIFHHPSSLRNPSSRLPEGRYTLLVIDPDSPDHLSQSYAPRLHYLKRDIPLTVSSGSVDLFQAEGIEEAKWEPPAPAKGSGNHRYVFVVIQQPATPSSIPETVENVARENFDLRTYLKERGLRSSDVVGVTLFRAKCTEEDDEYIKKVWKEYRGEEMPVYGKPPKELKYGYPLNARQLEREREMEEMVGRFDEDTDMNGEVLEEKDHLKDMEPELRDKAAVMKESSKGKLAV